MFQSEVWDNNSFYFQHQYRLHRLQKGLCYFLRIDCIEKKKIIGNRRELPSILCRTYPKKKEKLFIRISEIAQGLDEL